MYSVSETIENGKSLVTATPGIWINGHILLWPPPGQQVDRSIPTAPGPDWIPHMCRILKENIGKMIIVQIYKNIPATKFINLIEISKKNRFGFY